MLPAADLAVGFMGFLPTVTDAEGAHPPGEAHPQPPPTTVKPKHFAILAQAPWDNVHLVRYPREMIASYREHAPPTGLNEVVACRWENDHVRVRPQLVVPDGCIDLLWMGSEGPIVAGADTGPRMVQPLGESIAGVRLPPGAAGAVLGMPAAEVRDKQVNLSDVWGTGRPLINAAATDPADRLELLAREVVRRRAAPDRLVAAAARALAHPSARVRQVAEDLGVSERQLRRRTLDAIGYGPKMLARVARLRRLIALPGENLAVRAVLAGYASQAHMTEEVRRLTGRTPVRFLKDARVTTAARLGDARRRSHVMGQLAAS